MLMCVSCFGLVVSTYKVIGYRKTLLMTPSWGGQIISTEPRWKRVCVFVFFWFLCCYVFPSALHNIYISYAYGRI